MLSILLLKDAMKQWVLLLSSAASGLSPSGPLAFDASVGPQTASHVSPPGGVGATRRPDTDTISRLVVSGQPAKKDLRPFTQVDGRVMRSPVGLTINEDR